MAPSRTVTLAEVDQAEADLRETKRKARTRSATVADKRKYQESAQALTDVRRAFREQEEAAGRRVGMVDTTGQEG